MPCRVLEDPQPEHWSDSEDMVENIRLRCFVHDPCRIVGERVDLQRQTVVARRELADDHGHVLMDLRMMPQILEHVLPEHADIGELPPVDRVLPIDAMFLVIPPDLRRPFRHVIRDVMNLLELLDHLVCAEPNAARVEIDAALDPPPAGRLHAAPVAERVRDERIAGHHRDRFVEVHDFDRVERNIDHVAVRVVLRHLDPVADPHHIVGRELHASHEAENRIFEDEHQHRRQRAETAQDDQRILPDEARDHDDAADDEQDDLDDLDIAFDRTDLGDLERAVDRFERVQQRIQYDNCRDDHISGGQFLDQRLIDRKYRREEVDDDRRNEMGEFVEHLFLHDDVVPTVTVVANDPDNGVEYDFLGNEIGQNAQNGDKDDHDDVRNVQDHRVLHSRILQVMLNEIHVEPPNSVMRGVTFIIGDGGERGQSWGLSCSLKIHVTCQRTRLDSRSGRVLCLALFVHVCMERNLRLRFRNSGNLAGCCICASLERLLSRRIELAVVDSGEEYSRIAPFLIIRRLAFSAGYCGFE